MKVTVVFRNIPKKYSRKFNNKGITNIELSGEVKVLDILNILEIPENIVSLIVINNNLADFQTSLKGQDRIELFPIIAGG